MKVRIAEIRVKLKEVEIPADCPSCGTSLQADNSVRFARFEENALSGKLTGTRSGLMVQEEIEREPDIIEPHFLQCNECGFPLAEGEGSVVTYVDKW